MDVRPWRDTLDALTYPEGWIGRRDNKANLAYAVLDGYDRENGWIAHGIAATKVDQPDGTVKSIKPDEAYAAESQREAILQLAVLHELRRWDSQPQDSDTIVKNLNRQVVEAALTAPIGLRAKSVEVHGSKPYTEVDFAHGASAKHFFEDVLRRRLMRVDAATGVGLANHVPPTYEPDADDLIEQWGRVWTAGAALVQLDWAGAKGCSTAKDVARAIWCESDPAGGALNRFRPSAALIPTERKLVLTAHAELRTRAMVAYAFAGSEPLRMQEAERPSELSVPLRALSDARRVGEGKFYDGYNRAHLYLAVWSDCLHVANGPPIMPPRDPSVAGQTSGDAGATGTLAPEQRAALARTEAARHSVEAMRKAMRPPRRFHPGGALAGSGGADPMAGAAAGWEPIAQGSLRLLPAEPVPHARQQPIASIELWRELGPEVDWIDLLMVARIGDRQLALPVTMDDEVLADDGAARSLLVLDEGAHPPVHADALRRALQATDALVGVVVRKSLGAFVVLEVDMQAQVDPGEA